MKGLRLIYLLPSIFCPAVFDRVPSMQSPENKPENPAHGALIAIASKTAKGAVHVPALVRFPHPSQSLWECHPRLDHIWWVAPKSKRIGGSTTDFPVG